MSHPLNISRGLDALCLEVGYYTHKVLRLVDDVDQTDTGAMSRAIRAGLEGQLIADMAEQFAAAIEEDRTEAIIQGVALPHSKVRSPVYGTGEVLSVYRTYRRKIVDGTVTEAWETVWQYRVAFGRQVIATPATQVIWVGGLPMREAA